MSKDKAPEAAPKKGGKMKKLLVVGVGGTALIGAGAGAGIYLGGGLGEHKATPQDNYPKLVERSEKEEAASGEGGEGGGEIGADPGDAGQSLSLRIDIGDVGDIEVDDAG